MSDSSTFRFGRQTLLTVSVLLMLVSELPLIGQVPRGFNLLTLDPSQGTTFEAIMSAPETGYDWVLLISSPDGLNIQYAIPALYPENGTWAYFIQGIDSWLAPGRYPMELYSVASGVAPEEARNNGLLQGTYMLRVSPGDFFREDIPLNSSLTSIRTDSSDQRVEQSRVLTELLLTANPEGYVLPTGSGRRLPIEGEIYYTSGFGDRRTYIYNDGSTASSIHNGLDYRAAVGRPVYAPIAGKVVFADSRIVTGGTVILEHLPGVYSLYYHLESWDCSVGQVLQSGEVLGTAGASGLATASHLHWEIRVRGVAVHPLDFLQRILLDNGRLLEYF